MDITQIFEHCYKDENVENQKRALSWLIRVKELVEAEGKEPKLLLADEDFVSTLIQINKGSIGIGSAITRNMRFARKLLKYFGIDSCVVLTAKTKNESAEELFPDLDSVLDLVDEIGSIKNDGYHAGSLLNVKSLIILSWHELSLFEIGNFKKNDIIVLGEDKLFIRVNDGLIEITPREYSILAQYAENDYVIGISGRRYDYTENCEFLIRNNKGSQASDKRNFCSKIFERFNNEITPYRISIKQLRLSSQFEKVWKDSSCESNRKKLLKYVDCDTTRVNEYQKIYDLWLQKYHSEFKG